MPTLDYQSAPKPAPKPLFTPPRILIAISFLLYLLSLPLPACYVDSPSRSEWLYGGQFFLAGCFCGFFVYPAALANPLLFLAWLLTFFNERRRILPLALAFAALGLSLSFLFHSHLMLDEAGNEAVITAHGPAYWLWVSSTAFALIASIAKLRIPPPPLPPIPITPRVPVRDHDPVDETPVLEKLKAAGWITRYWSDRQDLYAEWTDLGRKRIQYWPQHTAELHLENENQRRVLEFFSHYLRSPLTPAPPPTH